MMYAVWYTAYDSNGHLRDLGCIDEVEAATPAAAGDLVEDALLSEGFMAVEIGEVNEQPS